MKRDDLPGLVDEFGRTSDDGFYLGDLMDYLAASLGRVDENEVYGLAASCRYLFESFEKPGVSLFFPRRMFFQGAEFRITPTPVEVEGGFLFPGHRFMPFLSRDVFPADVWLVLPDGSAPHVREIKLAKARAMDALCFFGKTQAQEYLEADNPANKNRSDSVLVATFDLRDYFAECGFRNGDSLMVRVLDWMQGVYSISHAPASQPLELSDVRNWTVAMRDAYKQMQDELGVEGDCYEQFSVMMLLGKEVGSYPLMKHPPLSLAAFFNAQQDIVVKTLADRAVFCNEGDEPMDNLFASLFGDPEDEPGELDDFFKQLGLSISEDEAEAYMRDALYRGKSSPDEVLARICAGRALYFKSADEQDDFHELWQELWEDIELFYDREQDAYAAARARLLELNDRCFAAMRGLDKQGAFEKVVQHPAFKDFNMLTASLSSLLVRLNGMPDDSETSPEKLSKTVDGLVPVLEDILLRLREG
ncbi:hypothetical protein [Pontiella sp.]|uniref:hypothetical protein n=1 Tax=Pontiella sp. TaxID=2837462 RepID=UPI003566B9E3